MILVSLFSMFVSFSASAAHYISRVDVSIKEPAVGEKCSSKASVPSGSGVVVSSVSWSGALKEGKFCRGENYTVTIKVKIPEGSLQVFATSGKISITLNGKAPTKVTTYDDRIIVFKQTWEQLGGPDVDAPDYQLKLKLKQLAAAYTADAATDDKQVLAYLKKKMPKAEIWSAGGSYKYTRRLPSETKDGNFSMAIGIVADGIRIDRYSFSVVIPALNKSPEAAKLSADKELMTKALKDLIVNAKTTGKDILAAVNSVAVNGTKAAWGENYTYSAPRADMMGHIDGDIILTLGDKREIIRAHKVLPVAAGATAAKIDADFSAMSKALQALELTNKTTEQEIIAVAKSALTNGSELVCTSFSKAKATYSAEGKIIANFELTLKGERRIPRFSKKIDKLEHIYTGPTDFNISNDEWEVFRLSNIERYKNCMPLIVMVEELQKAADVRAEEITVDYRKDHRRPNGQKYSTAINHEFAATRRTGENAYKGPKTPEAAVRGWMNSPGHRANILSGSYTYIGVGMFKNTEYKHWIQMFSSGGHVASYESSTGSYTFKSVEELESAYLICYTNEGIKAYIPFETEYMVQNGNDYTMNLHNHYITVTIMGE